MRKYLIWTIVIWLISLLIVGAFAFQWLPLSNLSFAILTIVIFLGAWKHPRQFFWLFLALLPLENIIISPASFPVSLRPFQLVGGVLIAVLFLSTIFKNKNFPQKLLRFDCFLCEIFKLKFCQIKKGENYLNPLDRLVAVLGVASLVGVQFAPDKTVSLKLSVILFSFLGLYWLTRNFIRQQRDILETIWFFLVGADAVIIFGIYQILAQKFGWPAFQVMAERINSTFTEPDWLGMYLVFLVAILFSWKYVFNAIAKDKEGKLLQRIADIRIFSWSAVRWGQWLLNFSLGIMIILLLATVARSAWLGGLAVVGAYLGIIWLKQGRKNFWQESVGLFLTALGAIIILQLFGLSNFHLGNRAVSSVSGQQKITISCQPNSSLSTGSKIDNITQLAKYNCRHINLEEIKSEKEKGRVVKEVYRPDPNVAIRKNIYGTTWREIKKHLVFGQGLGSAGSFLGRDDLGHSLNTSNIFLEVWLSLGLIGLIPFLLIFFLPLILGWKFLQIKAGKYGFKNKEFAGVFFLLTFLAILLPNLFNAGLLLGFFWVWLAVIVSSLEVLRG